MSGALVLPRNFLFVGSKLMYAFKKRPEFYFYTICGKSNCQLQNFENMLMNSIGLKFKIKADCQDRFNSLFRFSMVKFHFLSAFSIPNFVLLSISIYLYSLKPTTFIHNAHHIIPFNSFCRFTLFPEKTLSKY